MLKQVGTSASHTTYLATWGRDWGCQRLRRLAVVLLVLSLVLLKGRYLGIWHDSILYLGQVQALLQPEVFRRDLFFAYGGQASFTLLPWMIAGLVEHAGAGAAFIGLSILGVGAFWCASWVLLRTLLPRPHGFHGLLALLLLPSSYGAWEIFRYAEPFLTGRTFAEPLALLALALLVSGRHWAAAAIGLAATAMHPLQALPAAVVSWMWLLAADRRWLHGLWLVVAGLVSGMLLPQWGFLFERMDPQWQAQVMQRSAHVFLSKADVTDWYYLLTDLFIGTVAFGHAQGALRRYLGATLAASVVMLLASLLLADGMRLAWPAGLQLWRVHWLLHWSAMVVLPWLGWELWKGGSWMRVGVFAGVVLLGFLPGAAHPLVPGVALLFLAWPWLERRVGTGVQRALALLVFAVALMHVLDQASMLLPPWQGWVTGSWLAQLVGNLRPVWLVPVVAAGVWVWRTGRGQRLLLALVACGASYALLHWDGRPPSQHDFTDGRNGELPFGVDVAHDAQVFWLDEVLPTWSVLGRASYVSSPQMAGIVFSRQTSMEAFRRKEQLHVRGGKGRDCRLVVLPDEPHVRCRPDEEALRNACRQAQGELAYFVLPYRLGSVAAGTWKPPREDAGTYHLYACEDLLARAGASGIRSIE